MEVTHVTAVHVRVTVPTSTASNKTVMRLLSVLYHAWIISSREESDRTITWLRIPAPTPDDPVTPGDLLDSVRESLAAHGIAEGVSVEPYQPRPADSRGTGRGSPWRTRREALPTRFQGGPTP
jgi:hypothetical protein